MEALGRIERTCDLIERALPCNCMDSKGKPATGKRVKVQCVRHELLEILR
jgi:hypothetical protein